MNFESLQQEIEECVRNRDNEGALSKIREVVKRTKLTDSMRFHCSIWYSHLGDPHKALKILGKELDIHDVKAASHEQRRLQMRLAFMLSYFGARTSALRIIKNVFSKYSSDSSDMTTLNRYAGTIYFRNYQFAEALPYLKECQKIAQKNGTYHSYLSALNQIGMADCLDALGHTTEALAVVNEISTWWEECPSNTATLIHLSLGEYYLRSFELQKAEPYLLKTLAEMKENTKDWAYLQKWLGVLHFLKNDSATAATCFQKAHSALLLVEQNLPSIFEVVFWRATNGELALEDALVWPLMFHPIKHPLGQTLKDSNFKEAISPIPWQKFYQKIGATAKNGRAPQGKQICFISAGKLAVLSYAEVIQSKQKQLIDLVSGLFHKGSKNTTEFTEMEYKVLHFLALAGNYGVPIYMLIDLIYPNELADPESMYLRIEQVLKKIRKLGITVLRQANTLVLQEEAVVFSAHQAHQANPLNYLSLTCKKFTLLQACKKCNLSESKLKRLLKEQLTLGNLVKLDSDTYQWLREFDVG